MRRVIFIIPIIVLLFAFTEFTSQDEEWVAPKEAKELKNPISKSNKESSITMGRKIFDTKCSICHGETGRGDGAAAPRVGPKPANFTTEGVQKQEDGEIFWKLSNGKGFMPKWEIKLSEEERWSLVNYIRTLKKNK
ncbi:cytochrome c [Aquimarina sp. 2201CG5-10]|uniref:c-type cytochrome n=1 Tax=Aquimarina callyspongiae TaxID=3098150 RepID=UPI002AB42E80|nr:cytochrome c [Aquimarina sp. 2201CG5-10]MDY8137134.1 cytochrome c [Aquimarina sp. 2201CG5-10]